MGETLDAIGDYGVLIGGFVAAAALGAMIRAVVMSHLNGDFPLGTLAINVMASFTIGALSNLGEPWAIIVGIGGLGALSTWSSVANEVAALARANEGALALAYLGCTITTGVLAAWVGLQLAPRF